MNSLGLWFAWSALQATLVCFVGVGVYFVGRGRNPAAGVWVAVGVLVAIPAISILSLSPWPSWWTLAEADVLRDSSPTTVSSPAGLVPRDEMTAVDRSPESLPARADNATSVSFLAALRSGVQQVTVRSTDPGWRWPACVAAIALSGIVLGLARVLAGLAAVARLRRAGKPIHDESLDHLLVGLQSELGWTRPVALVEVPVEVIGSPATTGWLRPAIVLPASWRFWTGEQLRAVLAHEVAHIARHDFAYWVFAQVGVILHFYNPIVHWFASRLRLDQEMAADLCGARIGGGRRAYLTALAELALAEPPPAVSWATQAFLPRSGALMRRIEMLHQNLILPELSLSRAKRVSLVVVLVAMACLISGLRGSDPSAQAAAAGKADQQERPAVKTVAFAALKQKPNRLSYNDGTADGKKSLGGSGELISFTLPDEGAKVAGIHIHGSRYGMPQAPKENFMIYFLNEDMSETIATRTAPYSLFKRGPEQWVEVKFPKPIELPKEFWVAIDFRARQSKGVYVSFDSSSDGQHSRIGLPGVEATKPEFAGDWMIEAVLAK